MMDCHKILMLLTDFDDLKEINDDQLKIILEKINSCLPQDILNEIDNDKNIVSDINDTGWQYLCSLLCTIKTLCNTELSEQNYLITVDQLKIIKKAIQIGISIGVMPFLLPQIKIHATISRSKVFKLKSDDDDTIEKYKRASYTINVLLKCFDITIVRPAIISQLDCLLAALMQMSHAPLKKPALPNSTCDVSNTKFEMTSELYTQLKKEQEDFQKKLCKLIEDCPQSFLIKEMMVLMGIKNNPKWFTPNIKRYLVDCIMMPNGIVSLTMAICDEISDLGKCWDKLDVSAQLIATSHGSDIEKYYNSISSQILDLLTSNNNKQELLMAQCYIKALYDYNPGICVKKILNVIMEPFLGNQHVVEEHVKLICTEDQVSQSIENLSKLFITSEAAFKCLPTKILTSIAVPLFYLYIKSYKSIYVFRNKIQQLLLKILADESEIEIIFSVFLKHQTSDKFGKKLNFRFGINGGIEIISESISESDETQYEELGDCLFNLIENNEKLSFNLFIYLLKAIPKLITTSQKDQTGQLLETATDTMENIEKQIIAVKLLTLLSNLTQVQEAQIKNPEALLEFIKFFFSKAISSPKCDENNDQDIGILYTSLMLVKIIITNRNINSTLKVFQDFITSIQQEFDLKRLPEYVIEILKEIETEIKNKGKFYTKSYYDMSADNKKLNDFDKALADLTDPLIPVRAHGLIALTKLIDCHHPDVIAKKDFLLHVFQNNLEHEDSFIYLAAINGICAMSVMFPDKVIEILVQEFIGMTQQTESRDIPPETRAKLGEILVKTTRALGEMTPKYKSLLVNGFLSGVKDPDPMVRASSLSCLGEFCKIMGFRLGNLVIEILYCIGCVIKTDKDDKCRRAGVLVVTLLLRGLGKDTLTELGENLVPLYRNLKHLRDNDKDPVLQLHAQIALEEFNDIVQQFLFAKPKYEKTIFLLPN